MFKKLFIMLFLFFGTACGVSDKPEEGVYRMYFTLVETTVEHETPWPPGVYSSPMFWSLKTVYSHTYNRKDRWMRWWAFPEGLKETHNNKVWIYESLDWSEWEGWFETDKIVLQMKPTKSEDSLQDFNVDLFTISSKGSRKYSGVADWICENGIGVGCGDDHW